MKRFETYFAVAIILFSVGFNLWLYRLEPTAKIDPNDNTFQFALVERTNQIWDFAVEKCSKNILTFPICHISYLIDHWVPNWNEGYNLPYYYSHIPQIAIVASYRFFHMFLQSVSLFQYYHVAIYLLLSLFPFSVFLALLVLRLPILTAGFGALLASHLSTDGLYGLDPASFLWRGYGLSSQLFAMVFLPLAVACAYRYFQTKRGLLPAVLFLVLTTAGHLGVGIMAFLSLIPLALVKPKKTIIPLLTLSAAAIFFLSYWIGPAFFTDNFHNFSFWDPVWKFNSYGAKEILARLGNGDLFDFGRFPILTILVLVGVFSLFAAEGTGLTGLALLFIFWLLLYFGRTTWGGLINLIPAMAEFHLSRFIVGVHIAGLFLAPIGLTWMVTTISRRLFRLKNLQFVVSCILGLLFLIPVYQQTIRYNELNDTLVKRANDNFTKQSPDVSALVDALQKLQKTAPGRVFSGRGGSWGRDFRIAETNITMYLGNFGLPTVLWLPETWSPNGDTEQYFRENKQEDYDLYNIRYVATPKTLTKENIQPFWRLVRENPSWNLYEVPTSGYFTFGVQPAIVSSDKYSRTNVVRLWIQSDDPKNGLYPEITFDTKNFPKHTGLPNFKMLDEVTFQVPDGSTHNIFREPPKYISPISPPPAGGSPISISSQTNDTDMIFTANVSIPENCTECVVILKQTYHPNWRVTVDGKRVRPIITFPFFIGIPVPAGQHAIVASYEPSRAKVGLLIVEIITIMGIGLKMGIDKQRRNAAH